MRIDAIDEDDATVIADAITKSTVAVALQLQKAGFPINSAVFMIISKTISETIIKQLFGRDGSPKLH